MTSPWHIFSSLVLALPLAGAVVTGSVELRNSRDPAVRRKLDYSGVVVWLTQPHAAPLAPPARHARIVQKDKAFTPHVLAVQVGTSVDFPNFDPFFHNAFSNYDGQIFDVGLYPPGTSRTVRFTRAGIVRIFCNIHANMSAVIAVVDSDHFAVTGKDGKFAIEGVEPGSYTLRVFHERANPATLDGLVRRVTVAGDDVTLPALSISETGYLPVPHKNKYGQAYPPPPDEAGAYPSVR